VGNGWEGAHPLGYRVARGGEAGGRDSPCPVVVEERIECLHVDGSYVRMPKSE